VEALQSRDFGGKSREGVLGAPPVTKCDKAVWRRRHFSEDSSSNLEGSSVLEDKGSRYTPEPFDCKRK
jgi:hypothetical protein